MNIIKKRISVTLDLQAELSDVEMNDLPTNDQILEEFIDFIKKESNEEIVSVEGTVEDIE